MACCTFKVDALSSTQTLLLLIHSLFISSSPSQTKSHPVPSCHPVWQLALWCQINQKWLQDIPFPLSPLPLFRPFLFCIAVLWPGQSQERPKPRAAPHATSHPHEQCPLLLALLQLLNPYFSSSKHCSGMSFAPSFSFCLGSLCSDGEVSGLFLTVPRQLPAAWCCGSWLLHLRWCCLWIPERVHLQGWRFNCKCKELWTNTSETNGWAFLLSGE